MLVPLTRVKLEQLIPLIATGPQYVYYWGNIQKFLKRLLISFVGVTTFWLIGLFFGETGHAISLIFRTIAGLYWLWAPVYWASIRNASHRRYQYAGFLRGRILDVFITEELISQEENVNKLGELVIIENRERRINLIIGDESGFQAEIQAPLRRIHKVIIPGDVVELLTLSRKEDLSRISEITDVYLPRHKIWVGDYPFLRRDIFIDISYRLENFDNRPPSKSRSLGY